MRILVVSDSHGRNMNLFAAIENEPTAEVVYFLGDGARDFEEAMLYYGSGKMFIGVQGNCDFSTNFPVTDIRTVEGKKIYATHGFQEKVKFGLFGLMENATAENCDIAIFGHTHNGEYVYEDGRHYFNPGSIKEGNYGVIDITPGGIMCINKSL